MVAHNIYIRLVYHCGNDWTLRRSIGVLRRRSLGGGLEFRLGLGWALGVGLILFLVYILGYYNS